MFVASRFSFVKSRVYKIARLANTTMSLSLPDSQVAYERITQNPPTSPLSSEEQHANANLIIGLSEPSKSKRFFRMSKYTVHGYDLCSWKCDDFNYKKASARLPTKARGLFTHGESIVARGYDKFFNTGEVPATKVYFSSNVQWENMETNTAGPYEVTAKENGCIIFIGALSPDQLLVTSKHAAESDDKPETGIHAKNGYKWILKHLESAGRTEKELTSFLHQFNVTAILELCDDSFEEHVLEYPPERSGLYLHGVNRNFLHLNTWPIGSVDDFAKAFGFYIVKNVSFPTIQEVRDYTDTVRQNGSINEEGNPVEGFVVRCKLAGGDNAWFFKVKYDEPYLMFREWREVTKKLLTARKKKSRNPEVRFRYKLSERYIKWVTERIVDQPDWFKEYQDSRGIIHVRNEFVSWYKNSTQTEDIIAEVLNKPGSVTAHFHTDKGKKEKPIVTKSSSEVGKLLIMPTATIGLGKTTLALALAKIYGWGHIQNDNVSRKGGSKKFYAMINDQLRRNKVVIADRIALAQAVKDEHPDVKIAVLNFVPDSSDRGQLHDLAVNRVKARGENHQSLTPEKSDYERIMKDFEDQFRPVSEDCGYADFIFDINPTEDLETKVRKASEFICPLVKQDIVTDNLSTYVACEAAVNYKPTFTKYYPKESTAHKKKPHEKYYGVEVMSPLRSHVRHYFEVNKDVADGSFHETLSRNRRFNVPGLHITLLHRKELDKEGVAKNWEKLQAHAGTEVKGTVVGIMWDLHVMTLVVDALQPEWLSELKTTSGPFHITLGTSSDKVKPVEAKFLAETYWDEQSLPEHISVVKLNPADCWSFEGRIKGFVH